ncbi:hypothetical protein PG995_007999 [Apiospora arundinis]
MVVKEETLDFVIRMFMESCLNPDVSRPSWGDRGNDRSKLPLWLLDLQSPFVKVVHREDIQEPHAVEWATLSYARGLKMPQYRVVDGQAQPLYSLFDIPYLRERVPANALFDAIEIVYQLGIRYLWVDVLCSNWDPHDLESLCQSYTDTFQGAMINIQLPDHDFWALDQLTRELEELNEMAKTEFYPTLGADGLGPITGMLDATLFLYPFFANSWNCLDRLLSPRKLFYLPDGEVVWACASYCAHSLRGYLNDDLRDCLMSLPNYPFPEGQRLLLSSSSPSSSLMLATDRLQEKSTPPFSAIIETLSRCYNIVNDKDYIVIHHILAYAYGMAPDPGHWENGIGSLPVDYIWWGDVRWTSISDLGHTTYASTAWLLRVGIKLCLSSYWFFNKPPTCRSAARDAEAKALRGPHRLYKGSVGLCERGYELGCAQFSEPKLRRAGPGSWDLYADTLFASLQIAGVSGQSTFLGAGLVTGEPWGFEPPRMRYSKPYYIYSEEETEEMKEMGETRLMGRGIVDDPLWLQNEMLTIKAEEDWEKAEMALVGNTNPKLKNRRILTLAFLMRQTVEVRAADLPRCRRYGGAEMMPGPRLCVEHGYGCPEADVVTLEVNYGLILLTSDDDDEGDGIDLDRYERVGVFEVYGDNFAGDKVKIMYLR